MYKNLVERIHAESQQLQNNIAKNTLKEPLHELRKKDIIAQKEKFARYQELARKHYDKFTELEKKMQSFVKGWQILRHSMRHKLILISYDVTA